MGRGQRVKGFTFERQIVNRAKALGLAATRAWGSDGRSMGLPKGVDLVVNDKHLQCKRIKKLPKWLGMDKGLSGVVVREDYGEAYILIPLNDWLGYQT